jgi:putative transposase
MIEFNQQQPHPLPVERACFLLGLSRSHYYGATAFNTTVAGSAGRASEVEGLMERMEALVLEFPGYGYRRITRQLQREGWHVNHKRVLSLMRQHGWLCLPRHRWVRTTDSEHGLRIYPNLVPELVVTGLDQLWVADLTYIRLPQGFCYLAVILDAYSRKVIGWDLSHHLDARVAVAALRQALTVRQPPAGLVHHSDRGVQYACRDYVELLLSVKAIVSMSRRGCPRDNAQAESFFRTLKMEEVYLQEYSNFEAALAAIEAFIEAVYNRKRLHSSLGYLPPEEFEAMLTMPLAA